MIEPLSSLQVLDPRPGVAHFELAAILSTPATLVLGDHAAYSTSTNDPAEASRRAAATRPLPF